MREAIATNQVPKKSHKIVLVRQQQEELLPKLLLQFLDQD
jgi:hypothetical protein